MGNIHDPFKDEDVNGVIIGGDYVCGKLEYDGRQQGGQIYALDRDGVKEIALMMKEKLRYELGFSFSDIYPDDSKWRVVYYA